MKKVEQKEETFEEELCRALEEGVEELKKGNFKIRL